MNISDCQFAINRNEGVACQWQRSPQTGIIVVSSNAVAGGSALPVATIAFSGVGEYCFKVCGKEGRESGKASR
ncbi:MAG: hypothetical protein ACR2PT_08450 [Endozoicomonas sp.]